MKDQNSQQGSEANEFESNESLKQQGGFVAVLHRLEEQFYGPLMELSASAMKILLYIRHRALRDWTKRKVIGKSEIMKATGIKARTCDYALRELEREKHILVTRSRTGKVWNDNCYELHPERYGTDYIAAVKPSFRVIYGSKGHKSNQMPDEKDIHRDGEVYPQAEDLVQNCAPGVVSSIAPGVVSSIAPGGGVKIPETQDNRASKNPLKEPIERTLSENTLTLRERERAEAEEAKAMIRNILGGGTLKSMPR